jgi:hypothetical protein
MKTNTTNFFVAEDTMITSNCIAIAFFRPSTLTNDVSVNGIPIEAGDTLSVSQNVGDFDVSQYEVKFTSLGGSNVNKLHVIRVLLVG